MARLPQPGADDGTWGEILNDYLVVSHNLDGTVKDDAITSSTIQDGSIAGTKLQDNAVTSSKLAAGAGADGQVLTKDSLSGGGFAWTLPLVATVAVTTGSETRPNAEMVFWIGGTVQPTNMNEGDVWMMEA